MTPQPRKMFVNGIEMNVLISGTGPPVLLIHGYPDDHTVWRHQIPALVAAGYMVIAPDTRGCGETEIPPNEADYHIDNLVADMVALLDALRIQERVRLIAHDWGAVIGWQLVLRHSERVERYLALSVGHPANYKSGGLAQRLKSYYVFFFQLRGIAERLLRAGNWALYDLVAGYPEEAAHWHALLGRPGRLTAGINYYRANLRHLLSSDHPKAQVPVFGIWSSGDRFLTEGQMTASADNVDAPWRYHRIVGSNHWISLHAHALLKPLMLDYFRQEIECRNGPTMADPQLA